MRPSRPHTHTYAASKLFQTTLPRLLSESLEGAGERRLVVDGSRVLTRAEIAAAAARIQESLRERGVRPGDVVVAQLPNWWETVAVTVAVWGMGAVLNLVTPIYRRREMSEIIRALSPRLAIAPLTYRGHDHYSVIKDVVDDEGIDCDVTTLRSEEANDHSLVTSWTDPVHDLEVVDSVDNVALVMFTSGTTGRPKGVLHSQRTLLYEASSIGQRFVRAGDPVFMPSPLGHITGLLFGVLLPVLTDGEVVLMDRWDASQAVALIEQNQCTFSVGATPFLSGLVQEYASLDRRSSLRWFVCGGADIPGPLVTRARSVMGTSVARAYGLTEMPTLCCGAPSDPVDRLDATEGRVVGEAAARLGSAVGTAHELEIHGPELFLGYLDPADNTAAFTDDGWFRTGDLATIDEGYVTIVGRSKDVIVRGGENIGAKEIEDLACELDSVSEAAVVGVPDDELGERACIFVRTDAEAPTLETVTAHLDERGLAKQKWPEYLIVIDRLPRTVSGKVQKFMLREQAQDQLAKISRRPA